MGNAEANAVKQVVKPGGRIIGICPGVHIGNNSLQDLYIFLKRSGFKFFIGDVLIAWPGKASA